MTHKDFDKAIPTTITEINGGWLIHWGHPWFPDQKVPTVEKALEALEFSTKVLAFAFGVGTLKLSWRPTTEAGRLAVEKLRTQAPETAPSSPEPRQEPEE